MRTATCNETKTSRIPSLDGLRATSIIIVCLAHIGSMKDTPFPHFAHGGNLGVRVFFVISGMLITSMILAEQERTGAISLKRFYLRRAIRIFPAMWCYVIVIAGLSVGGVISVPLADIVHGLTYTMNYVQTGRSWYLGHLWSLSVEEQFYLVWPLVLCIGGRRLGKSAALAAVVLAPFLRALALLALPHASTGNGEWFPTACDAIATGCLLSLIREDRRQQVTRPWIASRWFFVVPVFVFLINMLQYRLENGVLRLFANSVGVTVMNIGIALIVERVVTFPRDHFGQILNSAPVTWLGRISYSLYLWQMPFLNHQDSSWVTRIPVSLVAALTAAAASYYLVEGPVLLLRERFGSRAADRLAMPEAPLPTW